MMGCLTSPRRRRLSLVLSVMVGSLWWGAAVGFAGKVVRIKTVPEMPLPFVTTVTAPQASHVAVSDVAGVVAIGHRFKHPVHVSLYRLDEQGNIAAGEPVSLTLPKPAALAAHTNLPLGVLFHPRLPLLYVWQDINPVVAFTLVDPALTAEFDHLHIYSLAEPEPKLLLSTARGPDYASGNLVGGFALNADATRLYVPSMQRLNATKVFTTGVGWITLDPDGLPAFDPVDAPLEEEEGVVPAPAASPPLDWAAASASHVTKLAGIAQAAAAGMPVAPRRFLETSWTFQSQPAPYSYAPLNDDIVFATPHAGIANWILTDRLSRISYLYIPPYLAYRYRIAVHPTAPSVYFTVVNYDGRLSRMEHADGYLTLVPQTLNLEGMVMHSTPLVLSKRNQVAVGANGRICLFDLEADGRLKDAPVQMTVNNPTVESLAWSEKFGHLYVPVEPMP